MSNIEGFSFEKEGFFDFIPNPVTKTDLQNNINVLQSQSNLININDSEITNNFYDLSQNIINYKSLRNEMKLTSYDSSYNKIPIPDRTDMIQTTTDVRKEDINILLLQQNYIYIVGSVTCATLLIAAIVIGRNQ
jgi:hypothetical protein